jgi:hypothetical protein
MEVFFCTTLYIVYTYNAFMKNQTNTDTEASREKAFTGVYIEDRALAIREIKTGRNRIKV